MHMTATGTNSSVLLGLFNAPGSEGIRVCMTTVTVPVWCLHSNITVPAATTITVTAVEQTVTIYYDNIQTIQAKTPSARITGLGQLFSCSPWFSTIGANLQHLKDLRLSELKSAKTGQYLGQRLIPDDFVVNFMSLPLVSPSTEANLVYLTPGNTANSTGLSVIYNTDRTLSILASSATGLLRFKSTYAHPLNNLTYVSIRLSGRILRLEQHIGLTSKVSEKITFAADRVAPGNSHIYMSSPWLKAATAHVSGLEILEADQVKPGKKIIASRNLPLAFTMTFTVTPGAAVVLAQESNLIYIGHQGSNMKDPVFSVGFIPNTSQLRFAVKIGSRLLWYFTAPAIPFEVSTPIIVDVQGRNIRVLYREGALTRIVANVTTPLDRVVGVMDVYASGSNQVPAKASVGLFQIVDLVPSMPGSQLSSPVNVNSTQAVIDFDIYSFGATNCSNTTNLFSGSAPSFTPGIDGFKLNMVRGTNRLSLELPFRSSGKYSTLALQFSADLPVGQFTTVRIEVGVNGRSARLFYNGNLVNEVPYPAQNLFLAAQKVYVSGTASEALLRDVFVRRYSSQDETAKSVCTLNTPFKKSSMTEQALILAEGRNLLGMPTVKGFFTSQSSQIANWNDQTLRMVQSAVLFEATFKPVAYMVNWGGLIRMMHTPYPMRLSFKVGSEVLVVDWEGVGPTASQIRLTGWSGSSEPVSTVNGLSPVSIIPCFDLYI
jgi:hypothetical protein